MCRQIGTPIYIAPEIVDGQRYGSPADVYSFGLVLLETLLVDSGTAQMREQFVATKQQFATVTGWRPTIPAQLWENHCDIAALVCQCWHQTPEERPTFAEVVKILGNEDPRSY